MRVTPRTTYRGTGTRARGRVLITAVVSLALAGAGTAGPAMASDQPRHAPANCPDVPRLIGYQLGPDLTTTTADLDGDGVREPVALSSRANGSTTAWPLATVIGAEPRLLLTEITDLDAHQTLRITGAADVDGDGDEEVLIRSGMGASTDIVQVWGLRDCRWTPLTFAPHDEAAGFLVGASVMHTEGVRCTYAADRNVMQNFRSFRIGDSNLHDLSVVSFTMADLRLTALGAEERFTVTDEVLQQSFPATFDCERGVSRGFPLVGGPTDPGTTTTTTTAPTPVKAKPTYTG